MMNITGPVVVEACLTLKKKRSIGIRHLIKK